MMRYLIRILVAFTISIAAYVPVPAQDASSEEIELLKRLNFQTTIYYRNSDYDRAVDPATRAIDLSTKLFGRRSVETAICLYNYAEILVGKKKFDQAILLFRELIDIYAEKTPDDLARISRMTDRIATIMAFDGRRAESETYFLENIERAEKRFGKGKMETLPALHALARFYVFTEQNAKADAIYLREYKVIWSNKAREYNGRESIDDEYTCFTRSRLSESERRASAKQFQTIFEEIFPSKGG